MIIISKYYKLYYKNKKGVQTSVKYDENYFSHDNIILLVCS